MKQFVFKNYLMFLFIGLSIIYLGCSKESKVQKSKNTINTEITIVKDLNALESSSLIKNKKGKVQIIDIRTASEYRQGHIKSAKNMDFLNKNLFINELKKLDPSQEYLVYCRSGNRSVRSLQIFKQLKFKKIYHLKDGFISWKVAGLPLE